MFKHFVLNLLTSILLSNLTLAQPGILDISFGLGGIVKTDIKAGNDYGFSSAIQSDGKIVVVGLAFVDTITYNDFVVLRYNLNGSLDSNFGVNGIVTTDFSGASDEAHSLCLQTDGKIVVAGRSNTNIGIDIALARYHSDGTLDLSFDIDGKLTTDLGGVNDYGNCVKMQSDGKIIVTGFTNSAAINKLATIRYNSDGSLDTSFDADGIVTTAYGQVYIDGQSMAIQSDGKILASATTKFPGNEYDVLLVRYNSDGSLDNTFDMDGIVSTDVCYHDDAYAVALQADGKIIVVGASYDTVNIAMGKNMMAVRYNINGSLDSTFGTDGKVFTEVTNEADFANAVAIQSNGKIVSIGRSADGVSNFKIILVRYLSDGSLDNTFGFFGKVVTNIANGHEYGQAVAIQADGKIVVSGFISNDISYNIFTARYQGDVPSNLGEVTTSKYSTIYPNPITTAAYLNTNWLMHKASIKLYNLLGQEVKNYNAVSGNSFLLVADGLNNGIYFLQILDEDKKVLTQKLEVRR